MALIFLQIILMFFFGILWTCGNGSKNWHVGWHDFGRQAIQVDVAGGRTANKPEKCGMGLTSVEESTVSDGSQIPIVTHVPMSNSLSLKY